MIHTIFPLFERGRIMKKEMLWAIRDYAYDFGQLITQSYSDGILIGCNLTVAANSIIVGKGIIKYQDFLYLVNQPQKIDYSSREVFVSLKVRFYPVQEQADFVRYDADLVLDEELEVQKDEIELCRFKLKSGFQLRNNYTCFEDIQTEFDTINLANSTFAAEDGPGISPYITKYFAKEALKCHLNNYWDSLFCFQCLNNSYALNPILIRRYIFEKLQVEDVNYSNEKSFEYLALILRNIQNGTEIHPEKNSKGKREILVV